MEVSARQAIGHQPRGVPQRDRPGQRPHGHGRHELAELVSTPISTSPFTQNSFALAVAAVRRVRRDGRRASSASPSSATSRRSSSSTPHRATSAATLQAPKVTLFKRPAGLRFRQRRQAPSVISVIPVVGDFAAAQQPVIVVLNEGTSMTVQAWFPTTGDSYGLRSCPLQPYRY